MTRVSVLLASVSVALLWSAGASAQTLNTFNPELRCAGPGLEDFKASGGCDPTSPIAMMVRNTALEEAEVWKVLFPYDFDLGVTRTDGTDIIFVISPNEPMSPVTASAMKRAEGPAFFDPVTGSIMVNGDTVFDSVADRSLDASLSRAIGMAIISNDADASRVMNSDSPSPVLLSAFEGFAAIPSVVADEAAPGISLSRDFSSPLFGAFGRGLSWGTARFWAEALKRTAQDTETELNFAAIGLHATFVELSAYPNADADLFARTTNETFDTYGWDRFAGDGLDYVYAEVMARHRLEKRYLETPVEDTSYTPGFPELVIEGELPSGYASAFYNLSVEAAALQDSWVEIELCYLHDDAEECDVDDDQLHLGVYGVLASYPDGARSLQLPSGTLIERPRRNTVRTEIGALLDQARSNPAEQGIPLSVSATTNDSEPVRYRLKVRGARINPPCSWTNMAATLNPWWRGQLASPDALAMSGRDVPPSIRAALTDGLSEQWYLTEESYRKDIGWDQSIFAGAAGQSRLNQIRNFLTDQQIAEAIALEAGITDLQADASFVMLMPTQAKASISGAFSDAGDVCVSPVAVSEMPDFGSMGDLAGQDIGEVLAQMGLPPELATAKSETEVLAIMMGMRGAAAELEDKKDVMLQVYSPNLWTQQLGFLPSGGAKPLSHSGVNGWRRNAGMNLYVRLPGTSPEDLKPGRYRATATMQFAKDMGEGGFEPERALPFYARGWGPEEKTEFEDYIENGLTGWLTIEKQSFGIATASLELSGQTWKHTSSAPGENANDAESAGPVQFRINRFLMLGVAKDEPLPVLSPLNLVAAQIPSPD